MAKRSRFVNRPPVRRYPWRKVKSFTKAGRITLYLAECGHKVARLTGYNFRHPKKVRCDRCGKGRGRL